MLGQRHLYWNLFRRRLEEDGFAVHEAVLPHFLLGDLEEATEHLVSQVLAWSVTGPVDLVCHSAGGLVGRRAFARLGDRVGHLVMLGTANQGTHVATALSVVPHVPLASQTRPDSAFLARLAGDPVDAKRMHCVWSPVDGIVVPGRRATLPGADNIELSWTGHWMFLWSRRVYVTVRDILKRPA
ncbi:MAG: hypothetical protein ACYDBQ_03275 [Thermoplasmatota archaeon]